MPRLFQATCLFAVVVWLNALQPLLGEDSTLDNSRVAEHCIPFEHRIDLFAFRGRPFNLDEEREVVILVNEGYMVGFSPRRNQPVWAAYVVGRAVRDTHFVRFPEFVDDTRLPAENRIGNATFGGGFDRGHMVPSHGISRQFGRVAQMETFLMSNVSPQKGPLNQGPWARLESAIVDQYAEDRGIVWVLVGPVFDDNPTQIRRAGGILVDVPTHYFCVLASNKDREGRNRIDILGLVLPQEMELRDNIEDEHIRSIDEIEELTNLNIFPNFSPQLQRRFEAEPAERLWTVAP